MEIDFLITSFVALFVIIDPIGLTPLFVALTQGMSAKARRKITIRAIGVAFFVLMLFALFGETVLGFVGISMPAFRVAGGILLFLTALDMLFQRRTKRREDQSEEEADDPSVFPLAIPLIAGPGSITTIILIAGCNAWPHWSGLGWVGGPCRIDNGVYLFLNGRWIGNTFGKNGD
jgi:multiple antibiotic resistance protein